MTELILGLYSTADGAHAFLASGDGSCLLEAHQAHKDSVIETALKALEPCLQALDSQSCHACLSLAKFADQISLGHLPGVTSLSLCKPQEALLAGTLGGTPGVVVQSADAFRGLGVDDEGRLKGLAQDEGGPLWIMDRLRQLQNLGPGELAEVESFTDLMKRASEGSEVCAALLHEAISTMIELLMHLLPQLLLREAAPISWSGPGMVSPLPTLLAERLEDHVRGLSWRKPQMSPAEGCTLLARAASQIASEGRIDDQVWTTLFQLSKERPHFPNERDHVIQ